MIENFDPTNVEENIKNKIDAFGRKWEIAHIRGSSQYGVKATPNHSNLQVPELMSGTWTRKDFLQARIDQYIERSWRQSELHKQKYERKMKGRKENKTENGTESNQELLQAESGA